MKEKTTLALGVRLGEISKEQCKIGANLEALDIERDLIIAELVRRYPHLKNDVNFQPRVRKRVNNDT